MGWWWLIDRFVYRTFRHELGRRLAELGDPKHVIAGIDKELRGENVWVTGSLHYASPIRPPKYIAVTPNWLFQARFGYTVLLRLAELIWVFKRRRPGPAWLPWDTRRYELNCRTRDGREWCVRTSDEEEIDRLFEQLLERRPALLVGWGGECLDLQEQGPAAVAAAYDGRAAEFEKLAPKAREAWLDASCRRFEEWAWNAE